MRYFLCCTVPKCLKRRLLAEIFFWISCTCSKVPFWPFLSFCQDGTFELVHEIQKNFWPKDFFWGIRKMPCTKNIHNFFQGPPNKGFRSVKVQTETFFKKNSRDFKNSFYLGFLWIQAWKAKLKVALFWLFIIVKKIAVWVGTIECCDC